VPGSCTHSFAHCGAGAGPRQIHTCESATLHDANQRGKGGSRLTPAPHCSRCGIRDSLPSGAGARTSARCALLELLRILQKLLERLADAGVQRRAACARCQVPAKSSSRGVSGPFRAASALQHLGTGRSGKRTGPYRPADPRCGRPFPRSPSPPPRGLCTQHGGQAESTDVMQRVQRRSQHARTASLGACDKQGARSAPAAVSQLFEQPRALAHGPPALALALILHPADGAGESGVAARRGLLAVRCAVRGASVALAALAPPRARPTLHLRRPAHPGPRLASLADASSQLPKLLLHFWCLDALP